MHFDTYYFESHPIPGVERLPLRCGVVKEECGALTGREHVVGLRGEVTPCEELRGREVSINHVASEQLSEYLSLVVLGVNVVDVHAGETWTS